MDDCLSEVATGLGVHAAGHHVYVCGAAEGSRCAPTGTGRDLWQYLKRRLHQLGMDGRQAERPRRGAAIEGGGPAPVVQRSKVDCLRVCVGGPIVVVYPAGTWYGHVTIELMERIIQEHLVDGQPVDAHVFAREFS